MVRKKDFKIKDLFDDFLADGFANLSANSNIGIVEFAENIVFNGDETLYPPQRAILKSLYHEELTEDELLILYDWKNDNFMSRTNWVHNRHYTSLVLEAGRGSILPGSFI